MQNINTTFKLQVLTYIWQEQKICIRYIQCFEPNINTLSILASKNKTKIKTVYHSAKVVQLCSKTLQLLRKNLDLKSIEENIQSWLLRQENLPGTCFCTKMELS